MTTAEEYSAFLKSLASPVPKMESVWGSFSDEELSEAKLIVHEILPGVEEPSAWTSAVAPAWWRFDGLIKRWLSRRFDLGQMLLAGDSILEMVERFDQRFDLSGDSWWDSLARRHPSAAAFGSIPNLLLGMRTSLRERRITVALEDLKSALVQICRYGREFARATPPDALMYWCARLRRKIPFENGWKCPMEWPEPSNSWLVYMRAQARWLASMIPAERFPADLWEFLWDENDERQGWPEPWWEQYIQEARELGNQDRLAAQEQREAVSA